MSYFESELMTTNVAVQLEIDNATTKAAADWVNPKLVQVGGPRGPHGRVHQEDLRSLAGQWWT